jgi:RNA polymerase II subunit A C-terminal domain phosphatase
LAPSTASASSSSSNAVADEVNKAVEEAEADAVLTKAAEVLDAQLEDRPLAKKQEELSEHDATTTSAVEPDSNQSMAEKASDSPVQTQEPVKIKQPRKALLTNDDHELDRIRSVRIITRILSVIRETE